MGLKLGMVVKLDNIRGCSGHANAVLHGDVFDDDALKAANVNSDVLLFWVVEHVNGAIDANASANFQLHAGGADRTWG